MKNTILYVVIFAMTFIVTTIVIYDLNKKYENIFELDFRLVEEVAKADSLALINNNKIEVVDTSLAQEKREENTEEIIKNYEETKNELDKTSQVLIEKEKELEQLKTLIQTRNKDEYEEWLKSTVKLYEEMESRKAGELLSLMPENEARELIYSMKKKRAAEILSGLDIETVKRLTKAKK